MYISVWAAHDSDLFVQTCPHSVSFVLHTMHAMGLLLLLLTFVRSRFRFSVKCSVIKVNANKHMHCVETTRGPCSGMRDAESAIYRKTLLSSLIRSTRAMSPEYTYNILHVRVCDHSSTLCAALYRDAAGGGVRVDADRPFLYGGSIPDVLINVVKIASTGAGGPARAGRPSSANRVRPAAAHERRNATGARGGSRDRPESGNALRHVFSNIQHSHYLNSRGPLYDNDLLFTYERKKRRAGAKIEKTDNDPLTWRVYNLNTKMKSHP
ncbi:hypothetical protein EVAR_46837_1 [Eumeta japonica]|uniref:Uncharacterized protein n=1 Tax=Eumeta variegata TaxID=151549 RepID=A0A4C1XPR4_EUMVA|nr:hypothetical protein EVAR_46837_1 [Eumeta japonica]